LPARIRACEARPGLAKCGGVKPHKGTKCRLRFCGTRAAERRRSSYRMLNAVSAYPTLPYYLVFIDVFYHNLTVGCYMTNHTNATPNKKYELGTKKRNPITPKAFNQSPKQTWPLLWYIFMNCTMMY